MSVYPGRCSKWKFMFACVNFVQILLNLPRNKRGSTSISAGNEQRVPFLLGEAQEYKEFSRKADIIPIVSVHCRTTNRKSKRVNIHQKKKKKKIDPRTEDVSDDASLSLIQPKKTAKEANEEEENITFDTFVCSFIQKCTTVDRYTQTATVSEVQSKLDAFIASIKARE
jgi:hypothetical protein